MRYAVAALPVIVIAFTLTSAARTAQLVFEIYTAAGSASLVAAGVAACFTLGVEGALFALAMLRAHRALQEEAAGKPRRVWTLAGLWRGVLVRMGLRSPLPRAEKPPADIVTPTLWLLVLVAVISNIAIGMRPFLDAAGSGSTLQALLSQLPHLPGHLQQMFVADLVFALAPPLVILIAGEALAHTAAERARGEVEGQSTFRAALSAWQAAFAHPLDTDEGQTILDELVAERVRASVSKRHVGTASVPAPLPASANGNGAHPRSGV